MQVSMKKKRRGRLAVASLRALLQCSLASPIYGNGAYPCQKLSDGQTEPMRKTQFYGSNISIGKLPNVVTATISTLDLNAIKPASADGVYHITFSPCVGYGKPTRKNSLVNFSVPLLNRIRCCGTQRHHGNECTSSVPCYNNHGSFLNHFWWLEASIEITNKNLSNPWMKIKHRATLTNSLSLFMESFQHKGQPQ